METQLLLRTAASRPLAAAAAGRLGRTPLLCQQQRRTKLTSNRMKRALNIPPHPDFITDPSRSQGDVVIFNPPASEPSVYHTPFKFLPKNDPRRRSNLAHLFASASSAPSPYAGGAAALSADSLPAVKVNTSRLVSEAEVREMREKRAADPNRWSVTALAREYDTTKTFVMLATGTSKMTDHKLEMREQLERVKERWGPKKIKAREDRDRRREMLFNGEL
ncbi:hypothetical protein MAPG_03989 [Magnaporthiopsis poae ATCC 64411]|uniref:60S ribosomal protein L20 n=1 Tax=Magnaporthiopsis poae (strain ATCC 64411 / 73-15) TaxID=644358 RepID=A0A0C4DVI4_MAGP6|nr:hypothetical protein MAPG_03989 [Magnaporthiopsis poae ATCC 64411]